jgi:hypothetical protein
MPGDDDHCAECGSDLAPGEDDVCPICSIVLDEIAKLAWQRALASVAAKQVALDAALEKQQG